MESGLPIFRANSTCSHVLRIPATSFPFHLRDSHTLWLGFPSHSIRFPIAYAGPYPDGISTSGLACSAFARRYLRNLVDFFSSAYLDVSLRRVPFMQLCIYCMIRDSSSRGFPHSDICGSRLICSSPQLFAACRVLLRLLMPRHSPCALDSLNFLNDTFFLVLSCLSFANN